MSFCDATSELSEDGCFHPPNHDGQHRGWAYHADGMPFEVFWENETPPKPTLTQAEVGILLTALVPVETYFPELRKKLELMQANG